MNAATVLYIINAPMLLLHEIASTGERERAHLFRESVPHANGI